MSLLIEETQPIARLAHECSVCFGVIAPGDIYVRQRVICDGEPGVWKGHRLCTAAYSLAHREAGLWSDETVDWEEVEPYVLAFFDALAAPPTALPGDEPTAGNSDD